jgi:nucleotide-binding universal stress UspA family protein
MEIMMIKDVMVRLDGSRADEARVAAADQIAEYFDSHIVCVFVNVLPMPIVEEDDGAGAIESVRLIDAARAVGDKQEAKLRQRLARLQKPIELRRFDSFSNLISDIAAREARTADVFVAMRPNGSPKDPDQLIESVLFGAGRHLFLVPEGKHVAPALDHVMIAWNGSREAARAVAEALPYLRKATTVSIVVVDETAPVEEQALLGNDLLGHLQHHGIGAKIHRVTKDDDVASTLIAESKRLKPDLMVMGGYGHSKMREWLLGGATYEMMHKSPMPLLMAH